MVTKLDRPLKREIMVDGAPYTLTITTDGFTLAPKGRRKGYSLMWVDLVSGDAALATALNASLSITPSPDRKREPPATDATPRTAAKKAKSR